MLLENIDSLIELIEQLGEESPSIARPGIIGTVGKYKGDILAGAAGLTAAAMTKNPVSGLQVYGAYKLYDTLSGNYSDKQKSLPSSVIAAGIGARLGLLGLGAAAAHNYAAAHNNPTTYYT